MEFWTKIASLSRDHGLRFLVIGGHAVAAHGYERTTRDVDVLVCKEQAAAWRAALEKSGYTLHSDGITFLQYNPPPGETWPVDLMLVNRQTFEGMWAEAIESHIGQARLFMVSLPHLLALKLFALKEERRHRSLKDMDDLLNLLEINRVKVKDAWFHELVLKYGTAELYEKIVHALG